MSGTTKKTRALQELLIACIGTTLLGGGISAVCLLLDKVFVV